MSAHPQPGHVDAVENTLRAWRTGIDTYQEPVVYMRRDCAVCRAEGFTTQARVKLSTGSASIVAGVRLISVQKVTVRIASKGAGVPA